MAKSPADGIFGKDTCQEIVRGADEYVLPSMATELQLVSSESDYDIWQEAKGSEVGESVCIGYCCIGISVEIPERNSLCKRRHR